MDLSLVVNSASGSPAVSFSPASPAFGNQTLYTNSQTQLVTFRNVGSGPLQVLSIVGDNNFFVPSPAILTLSAGASSTFSVGFDPSVTGAVQGKVSLYYAGAGSPAILPLSGYGVAPAPTTGTILVNGTLNGSLIPSYYVFDYTIQGPASLNGGGPDTFTATPGSYMIAFTGIPSYLTLASVSPSASQAVAAGGTITFTMNFTAANDFYPPYFSFPSGGMSPQVVPAGQPATYSIGMAYPPVGNAFSPINLAASGAPAGTSPIFSPNPMYSGSSSTLTVSTSSSTPKGAFTLGVTGTNSSGLSHQGGTSTLLVTSPPAQLAQLASVSSAGAQANGASGIYSPDASLSADGRYVAFSSGASNLAPGDSSGGVFVHDLKAGSTTLASVSNGGAPADYGAGSPRISANGRYVAFVSASDNLAPGTTVALQAVFVRDLQAGLTEREDLAQSGAGGNGEGYGAVISSDGRFVAFASYATNLVSAANTGTSQVYIRDRSTGDVTLVSIGTDGLAANGNANSPAISADGRFVAFASAAPNLVATSIAGINQLFVRDLQTGQTSLASVANDGTPANWVILSSGTGGGSAPAMSADGQFIVFSTSATNLVSQANDGNVHVYLRDISNQQTSLVDMDANGLLLGGWSSFVEPSISADGRWIVYSAFGQVLLRDMDSYQTVVISLAGDGTPGNGNASYPAISSGGSAIAFDSLASNLVSGDSNGLADTFVVLNPLIQTPYLTAVSLSSTSVAGSQTASGTVTLSGPAPAGGASVVVTSDNSGVQLPSVVQIPFGSAAGSFGLNTFLVPSEQVTTVTASYNGGSATALLTLEPAPVLGVFESNAEAFTQGQMGATYTVTVTNTGAEPTAGIITVAEIVPAGLTLVSMTGTNWTCISNNCTRSDVLNAGLSYPSITVTVNVGASATSPQLSQ